MAMAILRTSAPAPLPRMPSRRTPWLVLASLATVALLVLSGYSPHDRATWLMEVLPVMLAQALYFFESNTRSASILGVVGAGGIGLQIAERIKVRHWDEVAFIIILMVITVAVIDWLGGRLRRRLIGGRPQN